MILRCPKCHSTNVSHIPGFGKAPKGKYVCNSCHKTFTEEETIQMALEYVEVVQTKRDNKVVVYSTNAVSDFTAEIVAAIELVCNSRGFRPEIRRRDSIIVREDKELGRGQG
jgi:transposase-like protein